MYTWVGCSLNHFWLCLKSFWENVFNLVGFFDFNQLFPKVLFIFISPGPKQTGFYTHTSLAEAQCVQPKLRAVRNLVPQEWLLELSPRHDNRWEAGVLVRRDHCHLGGEDALSALYFTMSLFVIPSIWGTGSTECTHWLSLCFFMGVGILMAFIWVRLLSLCLFLYVFFPKQKKIF